MVKINSDTAMLNNGTLGLGCVIRDERRALMAIGIKRLTQIGKLRLQKLRLSNLVFVGPVLMNIRF